MKRLLAAIFIIVSMHIVTTSPVVSSEVVTREQRAILQALSQRYSERWQQERASAEILAKKLGIPIRHTDPDGRTIELQRFEDGRPVYYVTNNLNSARTMSTNLVWPGGSAGYTLSGAGETLGIWDAGAVRTTHQEFTGRVLQKDATDSLNDHATHVAGTMIAAGIDPDAHGMAFEAHLDAYDWNDDEAEMAAAAAVGLLVSNHSYGWVTGWFWSSEDSNWYWVGDPEISPDEDYYFGYYDEHAAQWDTVSWNAPYYLVVTSAGNDRGDGPKEQPIGHWEFADAEADTEKVWVEDVRRIDGGETGYDCIPTPSTSKNSLIVGAVWDIVHGYRKPSDVMPATFTYWGSSWGPTDDGRIKPDIVANGTYLYSAITESDVSYKYYSGTSMASPSVSGSVGLLLEHQRNLLSRKQQRNLSGDSPLRASTWKAILIHTADEAGPDPGPDYMYGWGLMNTASAAKLLSEHASDADRYIIEERSLNTGEQIEIRYLCPGGTRLRATICWTDPPGTSPEKSIDPPDLMLVNDLDLRVIGPDRQTYYPWTLDPDNPADPAAKGDNIRDNVEQVIVDNPIAATHTIQVTADGPIQFGPQYVSIIVTTERERLALNAPMIGLEGVSPNPTLHWLDIVGAQSYYVQVSTSEDFSSLVVDESGVTDSWFETNGLARNTTHYWRVRYADHLGVSDWSYPSYFMTGGETSAAGYTLLYDGVDDYVSVPHSAALDQIENTDIVTIEAWMYVKEWYNGYFPITDKYKPDWDWGWTYDATSWGGFGLGLVWTGIGCPYTFDLHTWYHLAVSYNKGEGLIRFYVNGELQCEEPFTADIPDTGPGDPLLIGFNPSGGDEYSNGMIDELRIWKVARTGQQIRDNMYTPLRGNEANLAAYFNFDEGGGSILNDRTGFGFPGDLINEPVWMVSTVPIEVPEKPELSYPPDGATDMPINPTLHWNQSPAAETYRLQLSVASNFSDIAVDQLDIAELFRTVESLLHGTTYYWRVSASNKHGDSQWSVKRHFTVRPGPLASIVMSPSTATKACTDTLRFSVQGYDANQNPVDAPVTWMVHPDSLGETDANGLFTASRQGSGWIIASTNGYSDSASITVIPGELTRIHIRPESTTVIVGHTFQFDILGYDQCENHLTPDVTWSVVPQHMGTIDETGLFTAMMEGQGWVIATHAFQDSAYVTVQRGMPIALTLSPAETTVASGQAITYSATATDGYTFWDVTGEIVLSTNDPEGSISENTYTAGQQGTWNVIGSFSYDSETLSDTSTVTVTIDVQCERGDVNCDGNITPGDALCAFWRAILGSFQDECECDCAETAAEVNCDGMITPGDALCIFWRSILGAWTQECECPAIKVTATPHTSLISLGQHEALAGRIVNIPLLCEDPYDLDAFSAEIFYDARSLEVVSITSSDMTENWTAIGGIKRDEGIISLGGFHREPVSAKGIVSLVEIEFRINDNALGKHYIDIGYLTDDLKGAEKERGKLMVRPVPRDFALEQNYPNPFNPTTSIQYSVISDQSTHHLPLITLKIHNLLGQEVASLVDEPKEEGYYTVTWDASRLSSGVYFYRLSSNEFSQTRRMVLIR